MDSWLKTVIFEHACKEDFTGVLKRMFDDKNLSTKMLQSFPVHEAATASDKQRIQPVFLLILILKKLSKDLNNIENSLLKNLSDIINLLETTYRQNIFISLKKYLTLISELKLLDLLKVMFLEDVSSDVIKKLNIYFPQWTPEYQKEMQKNFSIMNEKTLSKIAESHTQCRKLILKMAVDQQNRLKYFSEQYAKDMERIITELETYLNDVITSLETSAGYSVLEKMMSEKSASHDLSIQLLSEYVQTGVTDESLLRYLNDFGDNLSSEPIESLTSCLRPFDTMSEGSDDQDRDYDLSQSQYECTQDDTALIQSL